MYSINYIWKCIQHYSSDRRTAWVACTDHVGDGHVGQHLAHLVVDVKLGLGNGFIYGVPRHPLGYCEGVSHAVLWETTKHTIYFLSIHLLSSSILLQSSFSTIWHNHHGTLSGHRIKIKMVNTFTLAAECCVAFTDAALVVDAVVVGAALWRETGVKRHTANQSTPLHEIKGHDYDDDDGDDASSPELLLCSDTYSSVLKTKTNKWNKYEYKLR